MKNINIKPANKDQVEGICALINNEAAKSTVIKREPESLSRLWKNYFVAMKDEKIIGTVGFKVWPGRYPEVISLVVEKKYRNRGLGDKLIVKCLQKIKQNGHNVVFALTGIPSFFKKYGFKKIDIRMFPQKILKDCKHCPRNAGHPDNPLCDEAPMYLIF